MRNIDGEPVFHATRPLLMVQMRCPYFKPTQPCDGLAAEDEFDRANARVYDTDIDRLSFNQPGKQERGTGRKR